MTTESNGVTVYWRPGCPYCSRLLRDLRLLGLPFDKANIWESTRAAATVRSVAGGNETVPTVLVGQHALVNPRAAEVVDAARTHAPDALDELDSGALTKLARGPWHAGLAAAVLAVAIWVALATANPSTTYHFAPALVAAAWPVGRRLRAGQALPPPVAMVTALGGAVLALAATALLAATGSLTGPALFGLPDAMTESLVGVTIGTVAGAGLAALGRQSATPRQPSPDRP